ncbi:MAG TPA: glycosyltransferase [Gammaproteobacteria bacterium]|nr:glycosyltransferase [Gammaproteobacteria bacterium]
MSLRVCVLIPAYNHHRELERLLLRLLAQGLPVLLVDDGSGAETREALKALAMRYPAVRLHRLACNGGKGAAVLAGLAVLEAAGYSHALQIDADGQHDPDEAAVLLEAARHEPAALVSGVPRFDASVPRLRFYGRYLTHALVWLETLSFTIPDSMCGFRVYPLAATLAVARATHIGRRMDFDTEIMVKLRWAGTPLRFLPVAVRYPADGISHFRMFADNARLTWMHIRLIAGMLIRSTRLVFRGTAPRWDEVREAGSYAGLRLLAIVWRWGGRRFAQALLAPAVVWFFLVHGEVRRGSRRYLATIHECTEEKWRRRTRPTRRNVLRHLWHFADAGLDKYAIWAGLPAPPVRFPHQEIFLAEVRKGQGVLLLAAHLGNFEVARAIVGDWPEVRLNSIFYTGNARKFARFMQGSSVAYGERLIETAGPDVATGMLLSERIGAGEVIALVGDRTPRGARDGVIHAPFLGRSAPFPTGPYLLAHALGCPVYLSLCLREEDGYSVYCEPFAERIRLGREGRREELASLVARYAGRLEHYARSHPLDWFNFFDFWRPVPGVPAHE